MHEEEESTLVKWILEMQKHAHPISIFELRRKVAEITQERWTPFKDGIPSRGWLRWFRNRHLELTLRSAQGLEQGCCRVERSLLWEITGNLAATGNDLRVGNQLLFSKTKIVIKQTVFNYAHTKDPRPTSSIQR